MFPRRSSAWEDGSSFHGLGRVCVLVHGLWRVFVSVRGAGRVRASTVDTIVAAFQAKGLGCCEVSRLDSPCYDDLAAKMANWDGDTSDSEKGE
ncbi:hypothetical protein PspLS_00165 [Pyricularia sp. CBS 133598]|nr:hypothetical protein PspLS_00165 [Pyricularia sp. CBS 133598]